MTSHESLVLARGRGVAAAADDLRVRDAGTIVDVLHERGRRRQPGGFSFLADGETITQSVSWADLAQRVVSVSEAVRRHAGAGDRALLFFRPGVDFLTAFLGCLHAGVLAVPCVPPSRPFRRSLQRIREILRIAQPSVLLASGPALATSEDLHASAPDLARLPAVDPAHLPPATGSSPLARPDAPAFLQFTSGSTSAPKGVIVTHANLMNNLGNIYDRFQHDASSVSVTWLPVFHDMGLIDGMLQPIFGGFRCYAMPPHAFIQRPSRWLRAIMRMRATHSGGPNFAYDLCIQKITLAEAAGLDLGSWRVAYNAAEPIRVSTLARFVERFAGYGFRASAFHPSYGLAEATLAVTTSSAEDLHHRAFDAEGLERGEVMEVDPNTPRARWLASSGRTFADVDVAIVDPDSRRRLDERRLGEIWVAGPSVAAGYFANEEAGEHTFRATTVGGDAENGPTGRNYLRTGDYGFLVGGELFVAGRRKDLIILAGRNLYPQDIELSAESADPAIQSGATVAFSIDDGRRERLVVLVEWARPSIEGPVSDSAEVAIAVQRAVARDHRVDPDVVALVARGALLKTSSGKIRRAACRAAYRSGALTVLHAIEMDAEGGLGR